jgi:serine protease inhibitor
MNLTKGVEPQTFAPFRLEFNRPFFFALVVQGADTPLFMGSIANPVPM